MIEEEPVRREVARADDREPRTPGEQPRSEEPPPIDDAPVPPLTMPEDTEGG